MRLKISTILFAITVLAACSDSETIDWKPNPTTKSDGRTRILAIGNSFTDDMAAYLPDVLRQRHADSVIIACATSPGKSLAYHLDQMTRHEPTYVLYTSEGGAPYDTIFEATDIKTCIDFADWDVVVIQQVSSLAGDYASIHSAYTPVVENIRRGHPRAKIAWHETWAYASYYDHEDFALYDFSQAKMDSMIVATLDQIMAHEAPDIVIHSGEVIRQARREGLDASGRELSRDGRHLSEMGRWLVAEGAEEEMGVCQAQAAGDGGFNPHSPTGVGD